MLGMLLGEKKNDFLCWSPPAFFFASLFLLNNFWITTAHPAFAFIHICWNLTKGCWSFVHSSIKKWMNIFFFPFVWLSLVCAVDFVCVKTLCACLYEIWCKQNKLSPCSAVLLMFCPKIISPTLTFSFKISHCAFFHPCLNDINWHQTQGFHIVERESN